MNFHIYRELTSKTSSRVMYQCIGTARFKEDAEAMLARWHSGYIANDHGVIIFEKNLTKEKKPQDG